jgi:predicted kinase
MTAEARPTTGIVLLCGRSFSGKSAVAARFAQTLPATVVSLDAINAERGLWGGDGIPIREWARTHESARHRTRRIVESGAVVVIDDTSSPRFLRDGWRSLAHELAVPLVLVFVDTPVDVIRRRQAANRTHPSRRDVTDEVMDQHLASFEPPEADEDAVRVDGTAADLEPEVAAVLDRLRAWQRARR